MQTKGYVSYVGSKPFGNKVLYSFRLKTEDKWFGCGGTDPKVQIGDGIDFEYSEKNGRFDVMVPSIKRMEAAQVHQSTPSSELTRGMSKDDYWGDKAAKDVEKDLRIQWQSARNAAIETVAILVSSESLKLPEKNKTDAIIGKIADLTDKYYRESVDVGASESDESGDIGAAEAA